MFSPDGQWVAFFAEGKLKKAALAVVERAIINGSDMPTIPPKALQDLREALNIAA